MKFTRKQTIDKNGKIVKSSTWLIEVDFTNLEDLEDLFNKVKVQVQSLRTEKKGFTKKEQQAKRFDSCINIYNTDISDLYKDIQLDTNPIYYVYAHCLDNKIAIGKDGVTTWLASLGLNNMPFYIGKGTGNRAYNIDRNETHRKVKQKLGAFNQEVKVQIIKDGLTELEALCLESKLIDILGVMGKGGRLVNLDEGIKSQERQEKYMDDLININTYHESIKKHKQFIKK